MPTGDFGAYSKKGAKLATQYSSGKEGGAGMGFNLGVKAKFDIPSVDGLGIIVTGDIYYNGLNSDYKDDLEKREDNTESEISGGKYLNIPLMAGINYTHNISEDFGVFGEAALGANFRKITNMTDKNDYAESTYKYDMATTLGFQIGAGMIFKEKFSVGIHYYALGTSKVKGKYDSEGEYGYDDDNWKKSKGDEYDGDYNGSEDDTFKAGKLSTSMLVIRFGLHF